MNNLTFFAIPLPPVRLFNLINVILGFAISFGVDAYNYNIFMGSAPLYAYAIVRAVEFIIPSFVAFVIALIIKKNK